MRNLFLAVVLVGVCVGCRTTTPPIAVAPILYRIDEGTIQRESDDAGRAPNGTGPVRQVHADGQGPGGEGASQVAEMQFVIQPYKTQLDSQMNRVLAEVAFPLVGNSPEGNLGNWVADIMYAAGREYYPGREIAFAATNPGGLRVEEIGAGPLLVREVYELMPFDNKLVLLTLSGEEVAEFVAHMVRQGGWPVSEQLSVRRSDLGLDISVGGRPLDPKGTYNLVTIDYVANGGGNTTVLRSKEQVASGRYLRDALIDFAGRSKAPIDVRSTGERMDFR